MKYAAFLRGINVGVSVQVKMSDLKKLLERTGYENVKTLLASGNVVFEAGKTSTAKLEKEIEALLKKKYKKDIAVFVRTMDELEKLSAKQPFKGIKVTPQTRLYVTFCKSKPTDVNPSKEHPGYRILGVSGAAIFSVLELSPTVKTPDLMTVLGKGFGSVTMRNWNTVQKVLKA